MASRFEFAQQWGGRLRPIEFPIPKPLLPSATISFLHCAGVARAFGLTTSEHVRFEFLPAAVNLPVRELP